MGLSITAMLAAVASDLVIASNLPAAAELTWFQKFSITSLAYAFISLIESVIVLYFFYKKTDNIIPRWYSFMRDWVIVKKAARGKDVVLRKGSDLIESISHGVEFVGHGVKEMGDSKRGTDVPDSSEALDVGDSFEENGDKESTECNRDGINGITSSALKGTGISDDTKQADLDESSYASALSKDEDRPQSHVSDAYASFVKEAAEEPEVRIREPVPRSHSRRASLPPRNDWLHKTQSLIIPRDADDFINEQEVQTNLRWKELSAQIDDFSRVWIPISFFIALPILFFRTGAGY